MHIENPAAHRRMREILATLRGASPEADIPRDDIQIQWDHALLERHDVLEHVVNLRKEDTVATQPIILLPAAERRFLDDYTDYEADWMFQNRSDDGDDEFTELIHNFSNIIEDRNFQPYSELELALFENVRTSEDSAFPPHPRVMVDGSFNGEGSPLEGLNTEGVEFWAWYTPKGSASRPWGIYVRRHAPQFIAKEFLSDLGLPIHEAWWLATSIIFHHEYFHFLSQYHCDRISTTSPKELRYVDYNTYWHSNSHKVVEEGAANGYAYSKLPKKRILRESVTDYFLQQPAPYNRFLQFEPPNGFKAVAWQHTRQEPIDYKSLLEINPSLASVFHPQPSVSVPVYIIDQVPPGYAGPKFLSFDTIHFGPNVPQRLAMTDVPIKVKAKLLKMVRQLQAGDVDARSTLKCMESKSHFVQKVGRDWKAIWTQVQYVDGWVMVFFGTNREVAEYSRRKQI